MKKIINMAAIVMMTFPSMAQQKANIGMTINEVKKLYADVKTEHYENTITLTRSDILHGMPVEWGYRFENDKLNWIYFHKYIDELDKSHFDQCLDVTKNIIKDVTAMFGKPDTLVEGNTQFIYPYEKRHWGYDVLEARWNNANGMKIKVAFDFMGAKGEYHFIVNVNYFDKGYPYFD